MKLGAFELDEPIGHGGMGAVWRGTHHQEDIDVAVKVMRPDVMDDPDYREAFDREVRSVASLHHPHIVTILDFGRVPPDVADAAGEAISRGAPYLVMEYGHGGGVHEYMADMRWPDVRELLLITLDALAHAHARDVIHRDLKPENILVGCGPNWDVKLTDFGLAHATDRFRDSGTVETAWGTPQYMAPEQLRGLWRNYGPWTDLYGLGCMGFEMICGQFPYDGEAMVQIAYAHIENPIPRLEPRFEVPEGTEAWIRRMLAKERKDRFEHAADAAYALAQLPALEDRERFGVLFEPEDEGEEQAWEPGGPATVVLPDLEQAARADSQETRRGTPPDLTGSGSPEPIEADPTEAGHEKTAPLPTHWRRDRTAKIPDELIGISQDLFGLRAIPLVDRNPERDGLWQTLKQVHRDQRARQVVLEGAAGTGKSQLAKWFCRRAREVGGARVLKAYHGSHGGPADGLVAMVERFLRCAKLSEKDRRNHLAELLLAEGLAGKFNLETLLALFEGRGADGAATDRRQENSPTGRSERYAIIYQMLSLISRRRPVVVWLDDVQWGWDALGFAHYVQQRQAEEPAAIMVVITVRKEALEQRATEQRLLHALKGRDGVESVDVAPLSREDTEELLRNLLRLDEQLAQHVLDRSEGVPLFAVQLVEDWVARGKLVMGEDGFELRADADISLPDDLHRLWDDRIDALAQRWDHTQFRQQLEMAAALGKEVDHQEWEQTLQLAGLPEASRVVEELVEYDLARPMEGGWQFSHGMLQESLELRAQQAGRWAKWNSCCAVAIAALHGLDEPYVADRLAWHHLEAEEIERGLEALSVAIEQAIERSDYDHAIDLIEWREIAGGGSEAAVEAMGAVDRAFVALRRGQFGVAATLAQTVLDDDDVNDAELRARAALAAGVGLRGLGQLDRADRLLRQAAEAFDEQQRRYRAKAWLESGRIQEQRGDYEAAWELFDRGRQLYEQYGDRYGEALCWNAEGDVLRHMGRIEEATEATERALKLFRRLGNITGIADSLNDLAGLRRMQGDFDAAMALADEALRLYDAVGSKRRGVVQLNQALIQMEKAEISDAHALFEQLAERFERDQREAPLLVATAGLAAGWVGQGETAEARRVVKLLRERIEQADSSPPQLEPLLQLAVRFARDAGDEGLADELKQLGEGSPEGAQV